MLVPRRELDHAIAISNASYKVSRAVGPAIDGLAIAAISLYFPFWFYCATNSLVIGALLWWRAPRRAPETLAAERLFGAVSAGMGYARNNRDLDSTFIRAAAKMQEIGSERKRDGAWHVFDDPNEPGRIIETFLVHSLLDKVPQSSRDQGGPIDRGESARVSERATEAGHILSPRSGVASRGADGASWS
jgi:hypothetical protein